MSFGTRVRTLLATIGALAFLAGVVAGAFSLAGSIVLRLITGVDPAKFSDGLNPAPNLKKTINDLQPPQVFWVIKHGIKMTGMPSFGAGNPQIPDQTIWSIVAFLKRVPSVSDEEFKAWSLTN